MRAHPLTYCCEVRPERQSERRSIVYFILYCCFKSMLVFPLRTCSVPLIIPASPMYIYVANARQGDGVGQRMHTLARN